MKLRSCQRTLRVHINGAVDGPTVERTNLNIKPDWEGWEWWKPAIGVQTSERRQVPGVKFDVIYSQLCNDGYYNSNAWSRKGRATNWAVGARQVNGFNKQAS